MDWYMVILRILHIGGGIFWAGATFFFISVLLPAAQAAGPEGGKLMQGIAARSPRVISGSAIATIVSGLLLYWRASAGLQGAWIGSTTGLTFTVGAVAALVAFSLGFITSRPTSERLGAIGKAVAASGGPPSPAQMAEMQQLQAKLTASARTTAYLLGIAVLAMAAARYL